MTYKLLKLVSDYAGAGVYTNRLELGDSGLNGPVDLRFIDEAGWIENVHSVFFSMNGKDYSVLDGGSLISTSSTGDLVFFDPSNPYGRTLTQLYSGTGDGLWELNGSYIKPSDSKSVDMNGFEITKTLRVLGSLNSDFALRGSNDTDDDWIEFITWDHETEVLSFLDGSTSKTLAELAASGMPTSPAQGDVIYYSGSDWVKLAAGTSGYFLQTQGVSANPQWAASSGTGLWEIDGSYIKPLLNKPVTMEGAEITKVLQVRGSLNADFSLDGSNSTDSDWIEFLTWDHETEVLSLTDGGTSKTLAQLADSGMPSSPVQGDVIYYNGSDWVKLSPGTSGYFLQTQGASANPIWAASSGTGLWEIDGSYIKPLSGRPVTLEGEEITKVSQVRGSLNSDFSLDGSNAADTDWIEFITWTHATEVLSFTDGGTSKTLAELATGGMPTSPVQGDVIYYNGAAWARLAPGTNGHFLQTQGSSANPIWAASSGTGLWEISGSHVQLSTIRPVDLRGEEITKVLDLKGSLNSDIGLHGSNSTDTDWVEFLTWTHATEVLSFTDGSTSKTLTQLADDGMPSSPVQGDVIYYSGSDWVKLAPGTNGHFLQTQGASANPQWAASGGTCLWEVDGSYIKPSDSKSVDMNGFEITKALDLKGSLGADIGLHGSNAAHSAWIEFLNWNHTTENLELKVTTGNYIMLDVSGSTKLQVDSSGVYIAGHLEMGYVEIYNTEYLHFHNRTTDPSAPSAGTVYYNSSSNKLKLYNGSSWETISSS